MNVIARIVLTDVASALSIWGMFTTMTPTTRLPATPPSPAETPDSAWLIWRTELPSGQATLSVAELAECACPDLCDRDHANE